MAATREVAAPAQRPERPEALYAKLRPGPGKPASEVAAHQRARIHSAMIEIVADRGLAAVTVREITRLAGVSSRAFYKHFDGTQECFLATYDLVVRRAAIRVVASQAGEHDWEKRLRLAFDAFVREVQGAPHAARLALIDAYAGGSEALERIRHTENMFEAMLTESFARAPGGAEMPPRVMKGLAAGTARVARVGLLADGKASAPQVADQLSEWALSFQDASASLFAALDSRWMSQGPGVSSRKGKTRSRASSEARDLILAATVKLAAADGYDNLTVPKIRAAAGVPPRIFSVHFSGVDDCFIAALEFRADEAFTRAALAGSTGVAWPERVCRRLAALSAYFAGDQALARLCFIDGLAPGREGMRCRDRFISSTVDLLRDSESAAYPLDRLCVEASAGAIWGVLHHQVTSGQVRRLSRITPTLSLLALAPVIGTTAALDAIYTEQAN